MNHEGTILVVDDEARLRKVLGEILAIEGYSLAFASSGTEALALAAKLIPDLILLDVMMPVMDGFEVCRRVRADPDLAEIPVIMLTALGDPDSRLRGIQAGADDFIPKPFDAIELQARVRTITRLDRHRRLLKERSQRQQAESQREVALEALRESEERYRSLFDGMPIGLYRTTPEGQILDANPALVDMLGYPDLESLLASDAKDGYQDPQERARWQELVDHEGVVHSFEVQWRRSDGTVIWVRDTARVVRDDNGRAVCYEGAVEDITERKQAESQRDATLEALKESRAELERSRQALADRVAALEALHQIGVAMSSRLETDALMQFIVETGASLASAASCSVLLLDEESGELVFRAAVDGVVGMRVPPDRGIAARALRIRTPQIVHDVATDPEHYGGIEQKSNRSIRSLLSIPLLIGDKAIGVLTAINKRQGRFDGQDEALLVTLASHAAIAIENARLYEQALQEIMQRRQAEEALAALNATLEERVSQRTFDLQVLHDLSREIGNIRDADMCMRLVLANLPTAISHDIAAGILMTGGSCRLFLQPTRPITTAVRQEIRERMVRAFTLLSGKEIGLDQGMLPIQMLPVAKFDAAQPHLTDLGSTFQVPLVVSERDRVLGLLFVGAEQEEAFTEHQIRLLYTIAGQASLFLSVRRSEERLLAALQEKEVLLKEIHHRVKNNLQVVSSLLKLQSEYIQDPQTLAIFRESQHRVKTMALVHERLYRSQDLARIDFEEYIRSLAKDLLIAYSAHEAGVTLQVQAKGTFLDVSTATACGLIINELVSNALKHAFPDAKSGRIEIELCSNDEAYTLVVRDNGIGLPEGLDLRKTQSLGLKLVHTLVRQIRGTVVIHSQGGTKFEIVFPAANGGKRG